MSKVLKMSKPKAEPKTIRVLIDKPRTLILDFNATALIEERIGESMIGGKYQPKTVEDIGIFIWACLQTYAEGDPGSGIESEGPIDELTVLKHLFVHQFGEAVNIVMRLMSNSDADPDSLAPYVPTPYPVVEAALALSEPKPGEFLVDLGCGDGRVLGFAGNNFGLRVGGVERDATRVKIARELLKQMGVAGSVVQGRIQDYKFDDADIVFVYLLTPSNMKIRDDLGAKLKPGSRVVSHDFPMPDWVPVRTKTISTGTKHSTVYVYEIGKHLPEAKPEPIEVPEVEVSDETITEIATKLISEMPANETIQ